MIGAATNDDVVPRLVAAGCHKIAVEFAKSPNPPVSLDTCLSFLRTCSANPSTRAQVRADGVLDVVLPYIPCLGSNNGRELTRGFRAGK
jgi:hypothetical protein